MASAFTAWPFPVEDAGFLKPRKAEVQEKPEKHTDGPQASEQEEFNADPEPDTSGQIAEPECATGKCETNAVQERKTEETLAAAMTQMNTHTAVKKQGLSSSVRSDSVSTGEDRDTKEAAEELATLKGACPKGNSAEYEEEQEDSRWFPSRWLFGPLAKVCKKQWDLASLSAKNQGVREELMALESIPGILDANPLLREALRELDELRKQDWSKSKHTSKRWGQKGSRILGVAGRAIGWGLGKVKDKSDDFLYHRVLNVKNGKKDKDAHLGPTRAGIEPGKGTWTQRERVS
eukprot:CAMPEP_0178986288 /NCGR_PEP_ID=MMETSP0795-20121207/2625_1 /TAXON_ID=88552 /ORGANISM="Amoebophrya sp., Strain Ameob2" /LENGTH=290 /DNA_ID=CAMNT_0020677341 /DNA_START=197 /DNA_END=1070 /DNA_ORIENTATION=-